MVRGALGLADPGARPWELSVLHSLVTQALLWSQLTQESPAVIEASVHDSPGAGVSPTQRETLESEHQHNGAFRISCELS